MEFERQQRAATIKEFQVLQQQLAEAKHGLLAAARLSDQLEISHVQNAGLKDERKCFWACFALLHVNFS
jgi:thyroid receptor-interacting protein 11